MISTLVLFFILFGWTAFFVYSQDCSSFLGLSQATVNNFNDLNCAVQENISNIYINSSITFPSSIIVPKQSSIILTGVNSHILLIATSSLTDGGLFNITQNSNVFLENLNLLGSVSSNDPLITVYKSTFSLDSVNISNAQSLCGSAIISFKSNLNIARTIFSQNQASNSKCGSPIFLTSSIASFQDSLFENNIGIIGGASLFLNSNISFNNCRFINNTVSSSNKGGAVYGVSTIFKIVNTLFQNNSAFYGGSFYTLTSNLTVDNSKFYQNSATLHGGSFFLGNSHAIISNSQFTANSATSGGTFYMQEGSLIGDNSYFYENEAVTGGAIECHQNGDISFVSSNFSFNRAFSSGGGFNLKNGCNLKLDTVIFYKQKVSYTFDPISIGAGLTCDSSTMSIINSKFLQLNSSIGSAFYAFDCNVYVLNSEIDSSYSEDGTIICNSGTEFTFENSNFTNNIGVLSIGGILCSETTSCKIINSNIMHNSGNTMGALRIFMADVIISNSFFSNNYANSFASSVNLAYSSNSLVENTKFHSNYAGAYGGVISLESSSHLTLTNIDFYNNSAVNGGCIYAFENSFLNMTEIIFRNNSAMASGGSVYVENSCSVYGENISIQFSQAPYGGGFLVSYQSYLELDNVIADSNIADYAGGVIAIFDYVNLKINNGSFTNNYAGLGGVISGQYNVTLDISNSAFNDNSVASYGGGIYLMLDCFCTISNSIFTSNIAKIFGGAIFAESSLITMTASDFSNHYSQEGAVFYLTFSDLESSFDEFSNNGLTATIRGGVISASSQSSVSIYNSRFNKNQAKYGGALSIIESTLISENDNYQNCRALTGSCIYSTEYSQISLISDVFTNNTQKSSYEGLVSMITGFISILDSTFESNSFSTKGVVTLYTVSANIVNSSFLQNHAFGSSPYGGAIYITCAAPCLQISTNLTTNIIGSTFSKNKAFQGFGGVLYAENYPGIIYINSSVFSYNSASNGGAIASKYTPIYIANDTSFYYNIASQGGGGIFWFFDQDIHVNISEGTMNKGNEAAYGPFHATDIVSLTTIFNTESLQLSGGTLNEPIYVQILDYYGQTVTNSSLYSKETTTIYSAVFNDTGVLKGSSIVLAQEGVANFSGLILTGRPGGFSTLLFDIPIDTVSDTYQNIYFRNCTSGEIQVSVSGGLITCEKCPYGTYSFYPTDTECLPCPNHATCPGGNVLDLEKNYWRVDSTSASVLACPVPDVCLGGIDVATQCSYGNTGPYCTVCIPDYTKAQDGFCYSCSSSSQTTEAILSTVLFVVVLIILSLIYKYRQSIINYYNKKMMAMIKDRKLRTLRVKFKIVIAFSQIIYQLGPSFNIVFPVNFLRFINYYSLFQLNLFFIPNINCIVSTNYYDSLVFSTLFPFILFILVFIGIQLLIIRSKRLNSKNPSYTREKANGDIITIAFFISYVVLTSVSTQIFRVFQCESFDDGESYLVADYSINCNDPIHQSYVNYGIFMIFVYPFGIPLIYAIVLFSYRKLINPDWRKVIDAQEKSFVSNRVIQKEKIKVRNTYENIFKIRMLFDSYVPKRWYFELIDCARRLLLGAIPVLIFRGTSLQIIIVLIISLFSVANFMYFNPYIHVHDNHLAILTQWSITFIIISALIVKIEAIDQSNNRKSSNGLGLILILLNVIIFVFALLTAFMNGKEIPNDEDLVESLIIPGAQQPVEKKKKKKKKKKSNNNDEGNKEKDENDESDSDDEDEDDLSDDDDEEEKEEKKQDHETVENNITTKRNINDIDFDLPSDQSDVDSFDSDLEPDLLPSNQNFGAFKNRSQFKNSTPNNQEIELNTFELSGNLKKQSQNMETINPMYNINDIPQNFHSFQNKTRDEIDSDDEV